jgi:hypothetical protein
MDFIDLSEQLRALGSHPNKIGRYSVTNVQDIMTGRLTPELYLKPKTVDLRTIWRNFELGRAKHKIIERLIGEEYLKEQKLEYKITDDIMLVGIYDAYKDGVIYEWKTSDKLKYDLNAWNITQGKIYCSAFDKPKCFFYQPVFKKADNGRIQFGLMKFGEVKKDDEFFEQVKTKLIKFTEDLLAKEAYDKFLT